MKKETLSIDISLPAFIFMLVAFFADLKMALISLVVILILLNIGMLLNLKALKSADKLSSQNKSMFDRYRYLYIFYFVILYTLMYYLYQDYISNTLGEHYLRIFVLGIWLQLYYNLMTSFQEVLVKTRNGNENIWVKGGI